MRARRAFVTWAVALVAVVPAACGGDDGGAATVDVSMTEYAFDPAPITMPTDGELNVTNDGAEPHDLTIPELGKGTIPLAPGEAATLHLDGQDPGTYRVICDVADHAAKGMVTELTIG
jgi:plastocyanin